MQNTKDTFYLALRDRLATLNPERKVVIDGVERPAVLVAENEPDVAAPSLPNAYYLTWGPPRIVPGSENAERPLMKMECRASYRVGTSLAGAVDRGRILCELDTELLCLLVPPRTEKIDATKTPPAPTGSYVFWGGVEFGDGAEGFDRAATLPVFFFAKEQS
jgi:hypothetical protein